MKSFILPFLILLLLNPSAQASQCSSYLSELTEKLYTIGHLNTYNLYLRQGKYVWTDKGQEKMSEGDLERLKPEEDTQRLADAILHNSPDFMILTEVEGQESLDKFVRDYLGSEYTGYLTETNDNRNIHIALIVKNTSGKNPYKVEIESHAHLTMQNKKNKQTEPIFVRNLPFFKIFSRETGQHIITLVGIHFKSVRDRSNDPRSKYKRANEVDKSVELTLGQKMLFPTEPIIKLGDGNADITEDEFDPITEELGFIDAYEEFFFDPHNFGTTSHTYHPYNGGVVEGTLDHVYIDPMLKDKVEDVYIYRYKGKNGEPRPLPKTREQRDKNPSDHFPVFLRARLPL